MQSSSHVLKLVRMLLLNMLLWIKVLKIADGVTIRGTENNPVVIKKGSVVTEDIVR